MTTALTLYASDAAASGPAGAYKSYIVSGTPTNLWAYTLIGTATGWGELIPGGDTVTAWAAAGSAPAPSGKGLILDSTALEGQTIQAGNWTPTVRLNTASGAGNGFGNNGGTAQDASYTVTADIEVRWYVYNISSGVYTAIGTSTKTSQSITSAFTTYTLPATSCPAVGFGVGERLYWDLRLHITATTSAKANAEIRVNRFSSDGSGLTGDANFQLVTPGYSVSATSTRAVPASAALSAVTAHTRAAAASAALSVTPNRVVPASVALLAVVAQRGTYAPQWLIRVRDSGRNLIAEVDDYQAADILPTFNDVGAWSLTVRADLAVAGYLVFGNGVVFYRDVGDGAGFVPVLSGPIMSLERQGTQDNYLIASGPDDLFWLKARPALPVPGAADIAPGATGTASSAYDTRTGTASTVIQAYVNVNAGPGALAARRITGLTLAADPAIGTSVTGNVRFDNLLAACQQLALSGGDIGFRVVQSGTGLVFSCYQPVTRAAALFSLDLGNLHDFSYKRDAATANYVYALGGGAGTSRTLAEGYDSASLATYGRIETSIDCRDTTDAATLAQRIADELGRNKQKTNLAITPIDTPYLAWGRDYNLGDIVSVTIDGTTITDVVRQIHIALSPASGDVVTPAVGTPANADAQVSGILRGLVAQLRALHTRVAHLEAVQ